MTTTAPNTTTTPISLRVVGIFVNITVNVPGDINSLTVASVMQAAHQGNFTAAASNTSGTVPVPSAFSYVTDEQLFAGSSDPNIHQISAHFATSFTTPVKDLTYNPGLYTLAESFVPGVTPTSAYTVWQYYLFTSDGTRIPTTSPGESYSQQKLFINDALAARVVWRLVTIASNAPASSSVDPSAVSPRSPMAKLMMS